MIQNILSIINGYKIYKKIPPTFIKKKKLFLFLYELFILHNKKTNIKLKES